MNLHLDLAHPRPRPSSWGPWLLMAGLVCAFWAGWRFEVASSALEQANQQIDRMKAGTASLAQEARRTGNSKPSLALGPSATADTPQVLDADWSSLLSRLEQSRSGAIALLELQADAPQAHFSITADARNLDAMLAYVGGLTAAGLVNVGLESHSAVEEDGDEFIQFTVQGGWGPAGGKP